VGDKMKKDYVKNELINCILSGIALLLSIAISIVHWFSPFEILIFVILAIAFGRNVTQYIAEKKYIEEKRNEMTEHEQ